MLQLIYRTPDGAIKECLLSRDDEVSVEIATAERPFAFDGDGAAFQLACKAKRINLAFLSFMNPCYRASRYASS